MDRRSNQKIMRQEVLSFRARYFICLGSLLTLLLLGIVVLRLADNAYTDIQRDEMITMHPEQEGEIRQVFEYYHSGKNRLSLQYGVFTVLVTAVGAFFLHGIRKKELQYRNRCEQENMIWLLEQAEQLRKGNYHIMPLAYTNENEIDRVSELSCSTTEKWMEIENQIRELGYYMEMMMERLTKEENSMKVLISDISHQLKTPLASLRMSHELACESDISEKEREEFLMQEQTEIHRLETLLQELVNLSRLENHMIQIHPGHHNIKKTISDALGSVIIIAQEKQIALQVNMEEDTSVLHDPKWTAEAISNVIENAVKYSKDGTTITLSVQKLPNLIMISVEDEGIGIKTEESHKLFQRFFRGQEASRYAKDGAGIGLYLTRRILEEQGGTITAKKRQGPGTVFRITLPLG